ncbi:MAG: type I secretion system permease/ATPase [Burkholderiales bacterium]
MRWLFAPSLTPLLGLAAAASLAINLASLVPAVFMLQVFDRVLASRSLETLVMLTAVTLLALAFCFCMDTVRARALAWAGRAVDRTLSPLALRAVLAEAASPGHGVTGDVLHDVTQLRRFLAGSGVQALFDAPWMPVYIAAIALMHPLLGVVAALGGGLLVVVAAATEYLTRRELVRAASHSRSAARAAEALVRNAEVIAGMGMTSAALAGWQRGQDGLLSMQAALADRSAALAALARTMRQLVQVAMLAAGAWLVIGLDASAGVMVAATLLLARALQPVEQLVGGWKSLVDAREAWHRLERRTSHAAALPVALPDPIGQVQFEKVTFAPASAGRPLMRGVTFTLEPGEALGIVGPSGSGKTTLVRLLLGIWHPTAGTVRIDGASIAQWDRDALGARVGYLPQDVELFAGTVAANIARLGEVDAQEVIEAARRAHAHEMILRLPKGYETEIGEGGTVLSGGQRQRIALARALYGRPRLVVLDEPNANLDAEGERALAMALRDLRRERVTVVLVGHRPSMMSALDRIAVMGDGRLDAFGPAGTVLSRLRTIAPHAQSPAAEPDPSQLATVNA